MTKLISLCDKQKKTKLNLEKSLKREGEIKELIKTHIYTYTTGERRFALHEDIFYELMDFLPTATRRKEFMYITNSRYFRFSDIVSYSENSYYQCARYLNDRYKLIPDVQYDNYNTSPSLYEYLKYFAFHMLQRCKTIMTTDEEGNHNEVTARSNHSLLSMYISLLPFEDKFNELEILDLHRTCVLTEKDYGDMIKTLFKRYGLKNKLAMYNEKMTRDTLDAMLKL